jgi:hypothetical protein
MIKKKNSHQIEPLVSYDKHKNPVDVFLSIDDFLALTAKVDLLTERMAKIVEKNKKQHN